MDHRAPVPLTPAQRRLWVLAQLRPGDPFYNMPFVVDIRGPLDAAALGRCVAELVRRHPALRTRIQLAGGELVQVAERSGPARLAIEDLAGLGEREQAARADAVVAALGHASFDLAAGPLLRTLLLSLGQHSHRLVVATHHIVFDGMSFGIFIDELTALYTAFAAGLPSPLPEPPSYRDHILRQQAEQHRDSADSLAYWTARLAGAPEVMELPVRGPRPASTGYRAAHARRLIPGPVAERLAGAARRLGGTMFMILQAACATLLHQHGAPDVIMGTALSGRDSAEAERLIGYLAKPVLLRSEFTGDQDFMRLLRRVRTDIFDAHDHPDLAFEDVLRALGVTRDPGYDPLYQVTFGYEPGWRPVTAAGVTFTGSYADLPTAKAELEFALADTACGLAARISYRADLFDEAVIERLLARLETMLDRIGHDPGAAISDLTRPSDAERHLVVEAWNQTAAEYPRHLCLHHLVEEQASRTPDAIAARAGGRSWTYRELDEAANRVGHYLRDSGVGPEVRVGGHAALARAPRRHARHVQGWRRLRAPRRRPAAAAAAASCTGRGRRGRARRPQPGLGLRRPRRDAGHGRARRRAVRRRLPGRPGRVPGHFRQRGGDPLHLGIDRRPERRHPGAPQLRQHRLLGAPGTGHGPVRSRAADQRAGVRRVTMGDLHRARLRRQGDHRRGCPRARPHSRCGHLDSDHRRPLGLGRAAHATRSSLTD